MVTPGGVGVVEGGGASSRIYVVFNEKDKTFNGFPTTYWLEFTTKRMQMFLLFG